MHIISRMMKVCLYGVGLWAPTTVVFSQAVVTDVTTQLWSTQLQDLISMEAEYPSFIWPIPMENLVEDELVDKPEASLENFVIHHCAFHQTQSLQNIIWACDVTPLYKAYHQEYPKIFPDPFAFVMAFDEEGHPNQNWLVNRSPQLNVAWKTAGYHWDKVLTIGAKGSILTYKVSAGKRFDQLTSLNLPDKEGNNQVVGEPLWEYALPKALKNKFAMSALQAESLYDGGHILMLADSMDEPYHYKMIRLATNGQMIWQQDYQISELPYAFSYLQRNFLITADQHIVIYGLNTFKADPKKKGSQIQCLDPEGREIHQQFFPNIYWGKAFHGLSGNTDNWGFGLIHYDKETYESGQGSKALVSSKYHQLADGSEKKSDFVDVMFFNSDCQPSASSQLIIPSHDLGEKLWWDQIQAVAQTPDGHLLVVYLQQEEPSDDKLPFPNLYLAEFEPNGKLVRDTAIIVGENQDRAYLENKGDDVVDALNTQIVFLPKTKELLISVENLTLQQEYQIMLEEKEAVQRGNRYYFPRMYKVKLD